MIKKLLLSVFFILSVNFILADDGEKNKPLTYFVVDSFSISNIDITGYYDNTIRFFIYNDNKIVMALNKENNDIEIFDIKNHNFIKKISLSSKPKISINNIDIEDFYLHNKDSIFLFSPDNHKIVLMNIEGKISKIFNLNEPLEKFQSDNVSDAGCYNFYGNIWYDGKNKNIIIRSVPPYNWDTEKKFYEKNFISAYSLISRNFFISFGLYPKEIYSGDDYFPNEYQLTFLINSDSQTYIVSHRRDHHIYLYKLYTNDLIEKHDAKSDYLNTFDLIPRGFSPQKIINHLRQYGDYNYFLHNKYKKEYYRIVKHNQPLKNEKTGRLNHPINNRPFSILVFDENLVKKGECLFKNTKYTYLNLVPVDEGLLFIYQDDEVEDKFHFDIVNFH